MDNEPRRVIFIIDNKSFYASCEAVQRGYNPLKVPLVVMSEAKNTNGGLVLATSPEAKKLFHLQTNVSRKRDLPKDPRLIVVPPRMNLYIRRNLQINQIFTEFAANEDVFPYSIDESFIDMTNSWKLFGKSPRAVARKIQETIRKRLGLYTTVGIGDNPIQAKIALDHYAKHNHELIGEVHYETVREQIWTIKNLTDVWGIGKRTEKRLNRLHIHNMYELTHANPYYLKQEMGVIGMQLFAIAWGVDRSKIRERPIAKNASLGNSQVLPRDYVKKDEIETVIKEVGEQVASRVRSHKKLTSELSLSLGFSFAVSSEDGRSGMRHSMRIDPSDDDKYIVNNLIYMFRNHWDGQPVRNIAVYMNKLTPNNGQQLNLFSDTKKQVKNEKLDKVMDSIHKEFGFNKLVYANSLKKGGTAIKRSKLVGGHSGGNSYE